MTANLQTKGLTIREAARLMNVSERMVYMASELMRTDAGLSRDVEEDKISLFAALKIAKPEKYARKANGYSALMRAWNKANSDERAAFLATICNDT